GSIGGARKWREVIGTFDAGLEPFEIEATTDRDLMIFTSRLDLRRGLHPLRITNDNPTGFNVSISTIDLKLNNEMVGIRTFGGSADPYGYYPGFTTRLTGQVFDLDIRNATGVAVTPDRKWAFVGDWYIPRYFYMDSMSAYEIEDLHHVGSKVAIVKDPFGPNPQILGATSPIPLTFVEEVQVDASGKKLYVNFRNAGNIAVYDIENMKARAQSGAEDFGDLPLDHAWADDSDPDNIINMPAIDVQSLSRGLSLQDNQVLRLISPTGVVDLDGTSDDPLVFEWEIDTGLLGVDDYKSLLYFSALAPGEGLWPEDPFRSRKEDAASQFALGQATFLDLVEHLFSSDPSDPDAEDYNPGRILTVSDGLEIGKRYSIDVNGNVTEIGAAPDAKRTIVELDAAFRKVLTAGQFYYWGVEIEDRGINRAEAFTAKYVENTSTFSNVTILTHGFQLDPQTDLANSSFQQPGAFIDLARLISTAGGGGVVMLYDKNTGQWRQMKDNGTWGPAGASALIGGKPVVLVSDWKRESDISDSGFSEAAADALFAALLDLDLQTGGSLLESPLHFIGHSRGTSVNSEIIQRLGAFDIVTDGIHMTTLDPHDFEQKSLDIPLTQLVEYSQIALTAVSAVASVASAAGGNVPLGIQIAIWAWKLSQWLANATTGAAKNLGVQLKPVAYADFKDPNVQLWANVAFADNYYQTAANPDATPGTLVNHFTATPNGRSIAGADIDINLNGLAGFGQEDFLGFGLNMGAGGPHSRVWQWYAGTVNTGILEFEGNPIWRSIGDEGLATEALGLPMKDYKFTDIPWYEVDPDSIVSGVWDGGDLTEGIGTGWYFSPTGGGIAYRPGSGGSVPFNTDNTEVTDAPTGFPDVNTVFNGSFEYGTRQSLLNYLAWKISGAEDLPAEYGRFPISYELPGWSMHGGKGFTINVPVFGEIDIGGLFVVETSPTELFKTFAKRAIEGYIDQLFATARQKLLHFPQPPSVGFIQNTLISKFGSASDIAIAKYFKAANAVWKAGDAAIQLLDKIVNQIFSETGAPGPNINDALTGAPGPNGLPIGVDNIKAYLNFGIDQAVSFLPNMPSDYALVMGAGDALEKIIENVIPDGLSTMRDALLGYLDNNTSLDTITHNRMYIPQGKQFLRFNVYTPLAFLPDSKLEITFTNSTGSVTVEKAIDAGLFSGKDYSVEIPVGFAGTVSTIKIQHKGMGVTEEFRQSLQDLLDIDLIENWAPEFVGGAIQYVGGAFAGVVGGVSQIMLLDDLQFTDTVAGTPLLGETAATAETVEGVTLAQVESLLDEARTLWLQAAGTADALATLPSITVDVTDLTGSALAVFDGGVIRVDRDAAGSGWFVDATPLDSTEFTAVTTVGQYRASTSSVAFGRYDLLTVLTHEMGHALGLDDIPVSVTPVSLMTGTLGTGVRRLPSSTDLPADETPAPVVTPQAPVIVQTSQPVQTVAIPAVGQLLVGSGPLSVGLTNGAFSVSDPLTSQFGWTRTGDAAVTGGRGVLTEDDRFLSGLAQSFIIPDRATALRFTLVEVDLQANGNGPVDAFEVALLNADDDPLVGTATLANTDSLFNLQSDGHAFAADRVTVSGLTDRNGGLLDTSGAVDIEIDLTGLAPESVASLFFDLIGFGDTASRIVIDDVRFVLDASGNRPPVAGDDEADVDENGAVVIDLLVNDSDPDGDPLEVIIVTPPEHGALVDRGDGSFEYRPAANFSGGDAFTYRVSDGSLSSEDATVSIAVIGGNASPVVAQPAERNALEGESITVAVEASDPDGDVLAFSLVGAAHGATIDAATGEFHWTATDGDASYQFTVRVSDGAVEVDTVLTIDVGNVAPVLTAQGAATALSGQPYALTFGATDPGLDTITEWTIDWGDGTPAQTLAGSATGASHVYARPDLTHTINVSAKDEDGQWSADPLTVDVVNDHLYVTDLSGNDSGFEVRFSRTFDTVPINVFDTALSPKGAPDVVLRDSSGNAIRGSLVLHADRQGLDFVATGGALAAGSYTVQLASRDNAFRDDLGRTLDGDWNNVTGDDFAGEFTVAAHSATVAIADVTRASGQSADVPATGRGLPITLSTSVPVNSVAFDLVYNPAMLDVSALELGKGAPAGSSVRVDGVAGQYRITLTAASPIAAGSVELLRVRASVPAGVQYGAAQVLDIANVVVDGAAGTGDDGLHVAAYFGDSTGDQRYTSLDGQRVSRIVGGLDTGFGFYPNVDPIVISDVDR
ncbi:MAG: cadherin-like domain-containing protein, partial [Betaproteobacteria bacterium]|nr:cadherin-like domain-containing protein [Betaproteobacteria bacterium]